MLAGVLVILSLLVGTLGLVAIVNGTDLAAFFSGDARDSQAVAEAGANLIIATLNEPENRQLLVAGSTPPSAWSTTNLDLRSPCQSSTGERPGERNDGLPTQEAIDIAKGSLRDLAAPANQLPNTPPSGSRGFKLLAVRYSTGEKGSRDRRSFYQNYFLNSTRSNDGNIPDGKTFQKLNTLDDPDGNAGTKTAGNDSGFITLVVEGHVYKADGTPTTATITKEFEVVPKCCGGSFGSNGSGGSTKTDGSIPTNSLGADSRFCDNNYGMIIGINGGRVGALGAYYANYFTTVNSNNEVISLPEIIGVIRELNDPFDRRSEAQRTISIPMEGGGSRQFTVQVGCRTEPSSCNNGSDQMNGPGIRDSSNLATEYTNYFKNSLGPPARTVQPGFDCWISGDQPYRDRGSYNGTSLSCITITPTYLPGLPSIASRYNYPWAGNTSNRLEIISKTDRTSAQEGCTLYGSRVPKNLANAIYPCIYASKSTTITDFQTWIRANSAIAMDGRWVKTPFLEYCNTKYLTNKTCHSEPDGAGHGYHSWAIISEAGYVHGGISDDFHSNRLDGWTTSSTPRWPKPWEENDKSNSQIFSIPYNAETSGDVKFNNHEVTFENASDNRWSAPGTTAPAIARAVNLYAIKEPVLEFTVKIEGIGSFSNQSALILSYAYDSTSLLNTNQVKNKQGGYDNMAPSMFTTNQDIDTDNGWDELATISAGGVVDLKNYALDGGEQLRAAPRGSCTTSQAGTNTYTCWVQFPRAAYGPINPFSHYVKFRLRANSTFGGDDQINKVTLDDVAIKSYDSTSTNPGNPTYLNWCEYSSTFPVTRAFIGGFHCLGPTISLQGLRNNLWIDTTDASVSFYYNSEKDRRGTSSQDPLIKVFGPIMSNVDCPRDNPLTTMPSEDCSTMAAEISVNPVGQHGKFNIFGRDTPPDSTCTEAGSSAPNNPCQQWVKISQSIDQVNSPSRLSGVWIYMPWGYLTVSGTDENFTDAFTNPWFYNDNNWSISARIWVRSFSTVSRVHIRVPRSSLADITESVGSIGGQQKNFINWIGKDWVARATTATRIGNRL
jgi:hypothetical protein